MKSESFFTEMNCQQCREECERLLDESLSTEQRSEIEANVSAHLGICPECEHEFNLVKNLRATLPQLQNTMVAPPAFLRANIRATLVEEAQAKSNKKPFFIAPLWTRSLWAGTAVVAFGFLVLSQQFIQFSNQLPVTQTTTSKEIQPAQAPAQSAAPKPQIQAQKSANRKLELGKKPAAKGGIGLAERTPAPREQVFVAPAPRVNSPEPVRLPELSPSIVPAERPEAPKPKKSTAAATPVQKSSVVPPKTAMVVRPKKPASSAETTKASKSNSALPLPSVVKPAPEERLFSTQRRGEQPLPESVPPAIANANETADTNLAQTDWRSGKITLVLAHMPLRQGFSANIAKNNANNVPGEFEAPTGPAAKAPPANITQDANSRRAVDADSATSQRIREPKLQRGGGDSTMSVKAAPPSYSTMQAENGATSALIQCKLTLQSEFAVPNARLLQNGTLIWQGDLPAKKPVEIEWLAPTNATEKNSFVLEQIGPNGESNRKSLNLGD